MSNVYSISRSVDSLDEASEWLACIDRGLADEERAALQEWLAADSNNPAVLMEVAQVWDRMDALSRLAELFPETAASKVSTNWRPAMAAAVVMVVVLVGLWSLLPGFGFRWATMPDVAETSSEQLFQTAVGEQSTVNLSDGTTLTLNTNTQVSVIYTSAERRLELKRGEVYIQVAHSKSRPLNLYVDGKVVKAVGTAFNVKISQGQKVEVIVTEGKVLVAATAQNTLQKSKSVARPASVALPAPVAVSSGEKILMSQSEEEVFEIPPEEIEVSLSWRGGNLIFRGESLAEALKEIERYTQVEFVIVDENLEEMRVAGLFRAGDVEGLLSALQKNFDIAHERIDEKKVLLTKNSK